MTGSPILGYLTAIGMSINDLKDADTILLKLADHVKGMDPALARNWLRNIGIGDVFLIMCKFIMAAFLRPSYSDGLPF